MNPLTKCGQQEETPEHLLFDREALEQVRFDVFSLESKKKRENGWLYP